MKLEYFLDSQIRPHGSVMLMLTHDSGCWLVNIVHYLTATSDVSLVSGFVLLLIQNRNFTLNAFDIT